MMNSLGWYFIYKIPFLRGKKNHIVSKNNFHFYEDTIVLFKVVRLLKSPVENLAVKTDLLMRKFIIEEPI